MADVMPLPDRGAIKPGDAIHRSPILGEIPL
jgi:hypothetical protein